MRIQENVPLGPRCSLELGGPAEYWVEVDRDKDAVEALRWAGQRNLQVTVLGAGTNVVIADRGVNGLVLRLRTQGIRLHREGGMVLLEAAAGEDWDSLVEASVAEGLYGLECLSGIPGTAGAAPVQNIGAYGQELSSTLRHVRVLDRRNLQILTLDAIECGFGYRDSRFRRQPRRFVVLSIVLGLSVRPSEPSRHKDLLTALPAASTPSSRDIRAEVLKVRRDKSMVIRPGDPNGRSVGSFFVNPVVSESQADAILQKTEKMGTLASGERLPSYPQPNGQLKIPAAWLIEKAGFKKGQRAGAVGVSSRHSLALVHHGHGTTAELLNLAKTIQATVFDLFEVYLQPEPAFLGFDSVGPLAPNSP